MAVCVCQNSIIVNLKLVNFIICKLPLNKVDFWKLIKVSLLKCILVKISESAFVFHSPNSYCSSRVIQSYTESCVSHNDATPSQLTGNNT